MLTAARTLDPDVRKLRRRQVASFVGLAQGIANGVGKLLGGHLAILCVMTDGAASTTSPTAPAARDVTRDSGWAVIRATLIQANPPVHRACHLRGQPLPHRVCREGEIDHGPDRERRTFPQR